MDDSNKNMSKDNALDENKKLKDGDKNDYNDNDNNNDDDDDHKNNSNRSLGIENLMDENVGDNEGDKGKEQHEQSASFTILVHDRPSQLKHDVTNSSVASSSGSSGHLVENAAYPSRRAGLLPRQFSQERLRTSNRRNKSARDDTLRRMRLEGNISNEDGGDDILRDEDDDGTSAISADDSIIDFHKDSPNEMTMGRKIALRLAQYKWYNPSIAKLEQQERKMLSEAALELNTSFHLRRQRRLQQQLAEGPSLKRAWAYFEHVVLTRYEIKPDNHNPNTMNLLQKILYSFTNANETFNRATAGENRQPTRLYDPITTPHRQLGDFGLGFGLYFSTVRGIGYITLLAGLISLFNLWYFASDAYAFKELRNPLLLGSAICTRTAWVPCVNCNCEDPDQGWTRTERCDTIQEGITLIVKNRCLEEGGDMWKLALVGWASMVWMFIAILCLGSYLDDQTVKFDEDEQTAQDYSIVISNPPPQAINPTTWRRFFEDNFENVKVAAVTCAVNNDLLIRALVKRREILKSLELTLEPGTPMDIDNLALLAAKESRRGVRLLDRVIAAFFSYDLPHLLSQLVAINTSIKGLAQLSYPVTRVYVTFERECQQRFVLSKLASVGMLDIIRNNTQALHNDKYLFDGNLVLNVKESVEPNTVRWQDLNVSFSDRLRKMAFTNCITVGAIIAGFIVVSLAAPLSTVGVAFAIAGLNVIFPAFARRLMALEAHPTESKLQMSLYLKIAAFRWVNTAIVITIITPFTKTLADDGLIPHIYAIFFAEIVVMNVIQLTDVWGHFQRHVLAPRAKSQDAMNLCFQGLEVELAERYTNMTKMLYLTFWYSSIFPGALFLCAISLLTTYYADRFGMMRSWKRSPHVSTEISTYSRNYFFSTTCIFLAVMSSFYWSAFPFDNLCPEEEVSLDEGIFGSYITRTGVNVTIDGDSPVYRFCQQDFILHFSRFPFIGGPWMSKEQLRISTIYGWTTVAVLGLIACKILLTFASYLRTFFIGDFVEVGEDQGICFSEVKNITGYIPQVRSYKFSYPLIACKVDGIDQALFDWSDPERDYTYYDLTKDADHILAGSNRRAKHSFSQVGHYGNNVRRISSTKRKRRVMNDAFNTSRSIFNGVVYDLRPSIHEKNDFSSASFAN